MRQRIQKLLAETRREEIEADIAQVKARLAAAAADSALARALEGTLQIQQARLENLENSLRGLQYVNVELERIEKQLTLMAEGASVSRNPEQWSLSIDGMMRTIQGTSQWLADHNELLAPEVAVPPPTMAPPARTPQKH